MGRVTRVGVGKRGARIWVILGAVALALIVAIPAFGTFGSTPSKECSSSTWNGKYWKAEISSSFSIKSIESNVSTSLITLSIDKYKKATWSLKSSSDHAVFRIYEKGGQYSQVNGGFWLPGEGGTFAVEKSISHITFCFADIPNPKVSITKTTNGADATASDPNYIQFEEPVKWTYVVKNTGSVALKDIVVTDDKEGVIGTHSGPLDPGKTLTFYKSAVGGAERSDYPDGYSNIATVTAKSKIDGSAVEATDSSGYYGADPSISILVDGPDDPVLLGSTFQWLFTVKNTGNVPLSGVVVNENNVTVGNCSLGILLPGVTSTCTLTETATLGQETSTFVAKGIFDDGQTQNVISESTESLTYEINEPPTAVDDMDYETPERLPGGPITLIVGPDEGVLANDTDPDDDELLASGATEPTNEGSVVLASDGSFEYTPWDEYPWAADEFSRVDTFNYTVSDGRGGTDIGSVFITVNRVVCVGESVSDSDGDVEGVFTLLETTNNPCKHYEVGAEAGETPTGDLITLEIPGDDSNPSLFRGLLTFSPESLTPEGELILGVEYDPDLTDGLQLRTLPVCVDPVFEGGLVVDATLPQVNGDVVDTWCLAGLVGMATGSDGDVVVTYQAIGLEDPGFSAR
jgi:hypothetical protein